MVKTAWTKLALAAACIATSCVSFAADKVLRLSVWDGDEALKVIRNLTAEFEAKNPGIKVKLENYPDYALYHQKMLITYAAGVAPDVVMMDPANFQRLAKRGCLLPLNPFYEKTPGFDIKDYYKPIVDAHSYRGTSYVLPRDIAPIGIIYYNKKLFQEAGLPLPDGSWTWDFEMRPELKEKDFLWVCDQLKKHLKKTGVKGWAYSNGWPDILAQTVAYSTGARPVDNFEDPKKVTINDPKWIRAYQWTADFANKMGYAPSVSELQTTLMSTAQQLFVQQKIAMYQNGIWEVPNMRKVLKPGSPEFFEWDICLAPAYGPKSTPTQRFSRTPTGGSGYSIMSSTKYPDEAWKLCSFLAGPEGMTAMAKAGIAQPAIEKLAQEPGIWVPGPNTPKEERYPENRIATHQAVPFVEFGPTSDLWPGLNQSYIGKGIELVWQDKQTAKAQLEENAKLAQARLDVLLREENLPLFNWWIGAAVAAVIFAGILVFVYKPTWGKKLTLLERGENLSGYSFVSPWIIGTLVFTLGPMILSLLMAFCDWDILRAARFRGLTNFTEAFTEDPFFWKSLWVTGIYTFFAVPLGIAGSLLLALLLNQKVRGVTLFRAIYYLPSIASLVAASLIWRRMFNKDTGLLNTILYGGQDGSGFIGQWLTGLFEKPGVQVDWLNNEKTALIALIIMSLWGVGGGTVIFLAGLQGIPQFYYEAATLDGASTFGKFKTITLPMLTPTLFFTLVTGIIGTFQVFTQAFVMTQGGPNGATTFYVLHLYNNSFQSIRMGYASALGWILFFIVLFFTLLQFRMSKWVYYEGETK